MSREPIQLRPPVQAEQSIADEFALMSVDPIAFVHYHEEEALCSTELTEEAERLIQDLGGDRSRALEKIAKFFVDREEAAIKENEAKEEVVASASQKPKKKNEGEGELFDIEVAFASAAQVFSQEEEDVSPELFPFSISAGAFLIDSFDLETGFEREGPVVFSSQEVGREDPETLIEGLLTEPVPSRGIVVGAFLAVASTDSLSEKDFETPTLYFRSPIDWMASEAALGNPVPADSVQAGDSAKSSVAADEAFSPTPWEILDEDERSNGKWIHGAGVFAQNVESANSPRVAGDGFSFPLAVGGKGSDETGEIPYIFVPFLPPALVQRREAVGGSLASVGSNLSRPSQRVEGKTESGQQGSGGRDQQNPSDRQPGQQHS